MKLIELETDIAAFHIAAICEYIRDTINEIKLEESKIADRENAIHNAAPEVSVAT